MITSHFKKLSPKSRRNTLLSVCAVLAVVLVGFILAASRASGFFASSEPELATVGTNATVVNDAGASGGKAVQFNAPVTPPPAPPPPPSGGGSCPLPAYPDASCTGVPAGTVLTKVSGDVHITTAGAVVNGQDITGCLFIEANNVTVKNTRVNCDWAWAVRNGNNTGLVVQDSELICGPNGYTGVNGVFTARRLNVHGCENGFQPDDGTLIEDSYIWDLNLANNAHPDGAELGQGSGNITFRHNRIAAPITNSAIIMWDGDGAQNHDILIDSNFLSGGGFTLYCPRQNASNIVVTNNHFGPSNFGYTSSCTLGHVTTWTGNVDSSSGATIPPA